MNWKIMCPSFHCYVFCSEESCVELAAATARRPSSCFFSMRTLAAATRLSPSAIRAFSGSSTHSCFNSCNAQYRTSSIKTTGIDTTQCPWPFVRQATTAYTPLSAWCVALVSWWAVAGVGLAQVQTEQQRLWPLWHEWMRVRGQYIAGPSTLQAPHAQSTWDEMPHDSTAPGSGRCISAVFINRTISASSVLGANGGDTMNGIAP